MQSGLVDGVVVEDDVPAVEAVLAAVGDDVAGLPLAGAGVLGVDVALVSRWARPPQSMHVMTGSGATIATSLPRSV